MTKMLMFIIENADREKFTEYVTDTADNGILCSSEPTVEDTIRGLFQLRVDALNGEWDDIPSQIIAPVMEKMGIADWTYHIPIHIHAWEVSSR